MFHPAVASGGERSQLIVKPQCEQCTTADNGVLFVLYNNNRAVHSHISIGTQQEDWWSGLQSHMELEGQVDESYL